MVNNKIPTGNERISLPCIREADAAVEDITFLHMGVKGLIDIRGSGTHPLMKPHINVNGECVLLENLSWNRLNYWVPQFSAKAGVLKVTGTILTPIGERGFIYRLELSNNSCDVISCSAGLEGVWGSSWHCINEDKALDGKAHAYRSGWNDGIVFDFRYGVSVFSFAPMLSIKGSMDYKQTDEGLSYTVASSFQLSPGESKALEIFWGLGFEEVASTTSAKEMLRQGFSYLCQNTLQWLKKRSHHFNDEEINAIYHTNLFFNFFFASGLTLDTEEFVLVTSRSPRYYVSAAYWDRDSLLWSFPAILLVDTEYAKDMLDYVFTRQIKNVGVHSRYIDGTLLEPGFELDELCAPVIALYNYVKASGDENYLQEPYVIKGIRRILKILESKKHPHIDLYETFLQPTDDMHVYRYITYDNVLVWRSLNNIAEMFEDIFTPSEISGLLETAVRVKSAIQSHCIKEYNGKKIYGWSIDAKGNFDVYDEPPGSLQLLAFYGFCDKTDETFLNTVDVIRNDDYPYSFSKSNFPETGCPHAPHPWVLSIANSLLFGRCEHCKDILKRIKMDNLIACESVDENTGECVTGAAFATCAGFLAYAMRTSLV